MSAAYNIVGVVLGVIGLAGVVQLLRDLIVSRLPGQKLKELREILEETHVSFYSALEEGLPFSPAYVRNTENNLRALQSLADEARVKVHIHTGFWRQCRAWMRGLSREISNITTQAITIRAIISTESEQERQKLEDQGITRRVGLPTLHRTSHLGGPGPNQFQRSFHTRPATSARKLRPEAFITGDQALVATGPPANIVDPSAAVHTVDVSIGQEQIHLACFNPDAAGLPAPMVPDVALTGRPLGLATPTTLHAGTSTSTHVHAQAAPGPSSNPVGHVRPSGRDIYALNSALEELTHNVNKLAKTMD